MKKFWLDKNWNDNNLLPTLKNTHHLKVGEYKKIQNSKYISKFKIFSKKLPH
jgi:hypothetical protein